VFVHPECVWHYSVSVVSGVMVQLALTSKYRRSIFNLVSDISSSLSRSLRFWLGLIFHTLSPAVSGDATVRGAGTGEEESPCLCVHVDDDQASAT
jgi:hypothetical protein